jgi:hypothetical protein
MPCFSVRIELHGAVPADYNSLYVELEKNGFLDRVNAKGGGLYQLPSGEYSYSEKLASTATVMKKAKSASELVAKKFSILVTESSGIRFYGLEALNDAEGE